MNIFSVLQVSWWCYKWFAWLTSKIYFKCLLFSISTATTLLQATIIFCLGHHSSTLSVPCLHANPLLVHFPCSRIRSGQIMSFLCLKCSNGFPGPSEPRKSKPHLPLQFCLHYSLVTLALGLHSTICQTLAHLFYQEPLVHTTSHTFLTSQPKLTLRDEDGLFPSWHLEQGLFCLWFVSLAEYRYPRDRDFVLYLPGM